jgi:hypothetical protein
MGQPFDLTINCTSDNFKIFVNDFFVADFSKLHILPGSVLATPLVKSISYSSPNSGMKIQKLAWTYGM